MQRGGGGEKKRGKKREDRKEEKRGGGEGVKAKRKEKKNNAMSLLESTSSGATIHSECHNRTNDNRGEDCKRFFVYWIQSGERAYIGATIDPVKRLRQHNGEITGGAGRTRNRGPWRYICVISGFRTWKEALQYEWAAKHCSRRCRSVATRMTSIRTIETRERWTSNSPLSAEVPLRFELEPTRFGSPPAIYEPVVPDRDQQSTFVPKPRRVDFKRRLHGVGY